MKILRKLFAKKNPEEFFADWSRLNGGDSNNTKSILNGVVNDNLEKTQEAAERTGLWNKMIKDYKSGFGNIDTKLPDGTEIRIQRFGKGKHIFIMGKRKNPKNMMGYAYTSNNPGPNNLSQKIKESANKIGLKIELPKDDLDKTVKSLIRKNKAKHVAIGAGVAAVGAGLGYAAYKHRKNKKKEEE